MNSILGFALSDHMIRNGNKLMMKARARLSWAYMLHGDAPHKTASFRHAAAYRATMQSRIGLPCKARSAVISSPSPSSRYGVRRSSPPKSSCAALARRKSCFTGMCSPTSSSSPRIRTADPSGADPARNPPVCRERDLWQYPLFPDGKLCPQVQHGFQRRAAPRDDAHADCHSGPFFPDDRRAVQQATRRRLLYCVFGCFPRHLQRALHPKALHPIGDFLAIAAALSWAFYSTLVKKNRQSLQRDLHHPSNSSFTLSSPCSRFSRSAISVTTFHACWQPSTYLNLIFLGVIASSLCFLIWSKIIWKIGRVAVNNFIYLMPLITMLASWLLLDEHLTPIAIAGGLVILAGVYVSTQPPIGKNKTRTPPKRQKGRLP